MKKVSLLIATIIFSIIIGVVSSVGATENKAELESLKILAIGNSFSEDATEYIPIIARELGIKKIVIGNMYIGGCTIEKHAANARANAADYKYYKNTSFVTMSAGPSTKSVTLDKALRDEDWDFVTLQNSSVHSGLISKYNEDLDYMIDYVKDRCPDAKLGWHMTWAYQNDYKASSFENNYGSNQTRMYNYIISAVKSKIATNDNFDFIIPVGTAIQNARTSYMGDTLTRDGLHLELKVGRYIAAVTWMKVLGYDTSNIKLMTKYLPFVNEVSDNAIKNPYKVTQTVYTKEEGGVPVAVIPETKTPESTEAPKESVGSTAAVQVGDGGVKKEARREKSYAVAGALAFAAAAVVTAITYKKKRKNK